MSETRKIAAILASDLTPRDIFAAVTATTMSVPLYVVRSYPYNGANAARYSELNSKKAEVQDGNQARDPRDSVIGDLD